MNLQFRQNLYPRGGRPLDKGTGPQAAFGFGGVGDGRVVGLALGGVGPGKLEGCAEDEDADPMLENGSRKCPRCDCSMAATQNHHHRRRRPAPPRPIEAPRGDASQARSL